MEFRTPEELLGLRNKFPLKPGMLGLAAVLFLALIVVFTMFYSLGPDERGVVLFLGKYSRTTEPGLHVKMPFGIETVTPVKVDRIFKEEFGFRTEESGVRTRYANQSYLEESLMLTGDLNALEVTWIVQFKVKNPHDLLYNMRNPVGTIRDVSESVIRGLVGDYSVDEVLTTKRVEINTLAEERIQKNLDSYKSGVDIVTVKLQDVTPPKKVQSAFNEVNQANQELERVINQALQNYTEMIPKAKGTAEKTVLEAEAYAIERVNNAKGDAGRFNSQLVEYKTAPEVTRKRLYLEAMEKIMTQPKEKFVVDSAQTGLLPLLDFRKADKEVLS